MSKGGGGGGRRRGGGLHELRIADDEGLLVAFDVVKAEGELGEAVLLVSQVHVHCHTPLPYVRAHLWFTISQLTNADYSYYSECHPVM